MNPNGYSTDAWFEYGTDPALSSWTATTSQPMGSGVTILPIDASISGLTPYRTYYYRVAASNSGGTAKGAILPTSEWYVAVGDSITVGSGDDIPADGIGYEPILGNLLAAAKGYPNTIVNAGVSGTTSGDGANSISSTLLTYPFVKYYLVLYGTNDASIPAVPSGLGLNPGDPGYSGSYKANMQTIITAIKNAGKTPYLAKVPYTTNPSYSDTSIQDYNAAINELVADPLNGITVTPPDFYTLFFQTHPS